MWWNSNPANVLEHSIIQMYDITITTISDHHRAADISKLLASYSTSDLTSPDRRKFAPVRLITNRIFFIISLVFRRHSRQHFDVSQIELFLSSLIIFAPPAASDGRGDFHWATAQEVWGKEVPMESRGEAPVSPRPLEAEAVCRHCLQTLTAKAIKI